MPDQEIIIRTSVPTRDLRLLFQAGELEPGSQNADAIKVLQQQLRVAGYLSDSSITSSFDESTEQGIKLFQRYQRLPQTGVMDEATLAGLLRPRYDNLPDVPFPVDVAHASASEELVASAHYVANAYRWKKTDISFSFQNFGQDLTRQQVQTILRDAFAEWSDTTPLKFYEQADGDGVDIRISFANIDAAGGTLAVATTTYSGDTIRRVTIRFDEFETWSAINRSQTGQPIELFIVAVHEIGHAIGLGHSAETDAVMYAYYNPAIDSLRQDDINGIRSIYGGDQAKNVLRDTAVFSPDAVNFNGRLMLGWAGTNSRNSLNVMASQEESVWADKVTLGDTSPVGISLAVFNNRLYMAWSGTGNRQLNVMSSPDGLSWSNKVTLGDTSRARPTLTVHNGQLVMGWTGTDSAGRLNVIFSRDGMNWFGKRTLGDTSVDAPALASFQNRLYIAWTGTNRSRNLNVMSSADSGASWQNKRILGDNSLVGPSLLVYGGRLYLAWSGTDNLRRINTLFSSDGTNWGGKVTYGDTTNYTPELVDAYGRLNVVWTGRDTRQSLNVMTI